jgi:hypothetical protein
MTKAIQFLHHYVLEMPWFAYAIKWVVVLLMAGFFFVGFVGSPLEIKRLWTDRNVVPVNDTFYVRTQSIKPWFSIFFCQATESKLHMELTTESGIKLQLDPHPEPFGFNNSTTLKKFVVRHYIPDGVKPGEKIRVWKVVGYKCLGIPRQVVSPSYTFKIGPKVIFENSRSRSFRPVQNRGRLIPDIVEDIPSK